MCHLKSREHDMRRYNWCMLYYVVVAVYVRVGNFRYLHYGIIVPSTDSCVHAYTINRENVVL